MPSSRSKFKLLWKGDKIPPAMAQAAIAAVNEVTLRMEAKAKTQLFKGHGLLSGNLKRDVQTIPARREGMRVIGGFGTSQLTSAYALVIEKRYRYIRHGYEAVKAQSRSILARHLRSARNGN